MSEISAEMLAALKKAEFLLGWMTEDLEAFDKMSRRSGKAPLKWEPGEAFLAIKAGTKQIKEAIAKAEAEQ